MVGRGRLCYSSSWLPSGPRSQIRCVDVTTKDGADGPQRGAAASQHHRGLSEGPGRLHQEVGPLHQPSSVSPRRTQPHRVEDPIPCVFRVFRRSALYHVALRPPLPRGAQSALIGRTLCTCVGNFTPLRGCKHCGQPGGGSSAPQPRPLLHSLRA